jgi:hypothetical protein
MAGGATFAFHIPTDTFDVRLGVFGDPPNGLW